MLSPADDTGKRPVEDVLRDEKLSSLCEEPPSTVPTGTSLRDVITLLESDESDGAVLVTDSQTPGKLAGIFTERDYLDKIAGSSIDLDHPVDQWMTPNPRTVSCEESFHTAIQLMTAGGYRHLPVVGDDGELRGLVSTRDIIVHLAEYFPMEVYNLPPRLHQNQRISSREGG